MGLLDGFYSLGAKINKVFDSNNEELTQGVVSPLLPELELDLSDDELIALQKKWIARYEPYQKEIAAKQEENENYWKGKQFSPDGQSVNQAQKRSMSDNLIFQSLETFLPVATSRPPEPIVTSDNTPEGEALADKVSKMLVHLADVLRFRLKLKQVLRFWSLYYLGALKVGWDIELNDITVKVIRPQKLILDPTACIEESRYNGEYIGEYKKDTAADLVKKFPKKKDEITSLVNGNLGTEMQYIEWWTRDYVFWSMDRIVLGKSKNPHWNYEEEVVVTDEYGVETVDKVRGSNHFENPEMPYTFLSIFSLGLQPHDETNLIEQCLPIQDLVNKRMRQIDKNADATNGSIAVSGDAFSKEEATQVDYAARTGKTFWVPTGDVSSAINRISAPPLPSFVAESLYDYRSQLLNIFGVTGVTAQGISSEKTVRGKIIVKGQDTERIGGGITEYLEQMADYTFNWFVQLIYVYYDEEHAASVIGKERATEYIVLKKSDLNRKLLVSVREGSTIPKDSVTRANQAVDLATVGLLDPLTMYERLDFPNPREAAEKLVMYKTNPTSLLGSNMPQQQPQPTEEQILSQVDIQ